MRSKNWRCLASWFAARPTALNTLCAGISGFLEEIKDVAKRKPEMQPTALDTERGKDVYLRRPFSGHISRIAIFVQNPNQFRLLGWRYRLKRVNSREQGTIAFVPPSCRQFVKHAEHPLSLRARNSRHMLTTSPCTPSHTRIAMRSSAHQLYYQEASTIATAKRLFPF